MKDSDRSITLGDLELDVMSTLWDASVPLTVADVQTRLGEQRELAYTTILTVLSNLHKKKAVDRAKKGKAHVYWARRERDQVAGGVFQNLLSKFYGGNPAELLAGFLKSSDPLTPNQIRDLKTELERLEQEYE